MIRVEGTQEGRSVVVSSDHKFKLDLDRFEQMMEVFWSQIESNEDNKRVVHTKKLKLHWQPMENEYLYLSLPNKDLEDLKTSWT